MSGNAGSLLCVAYGGGHIRACLPALAVLRDRSWRVELLALTTGYAVARDAGFDAWRAVDLVAGPDDPVWVEGRQLIDENAKKGPIGIEETQAYLGFGFYDLVQAHGRQSAQRIFDEQGRYAFRPNTLALRAIQRAQPDVVLATNSPRAERAATEVAQAAGIPAVVLNDLFLAAEYDWLVDPGYADRILVLNEQVRQSFIDAGHAAAKVIATGNPALEPMFALRGKRPPRTPGQRINILFADQPASRENAEIFSATYQALAELAKRRRDWIISVRLHPSNVHANVEIAAPLKLQDRCTLEEALLSSDVVVTHGSTLGLEAAIAGVPVVQVLGSSVATATRFDEKGLAVAAETPDDLEHAITRALSEQSDVQAIMPDEAARRVADAIEDVYRAGQSR